MYRKILVPVGALVICAAVLVAFSGIARDQIADAFGFRDGSEPANVHKALQDGVVTEGELKAAFDETANCIEAEGISVIRYGDPRLEGRLGYTVNPEGTDNIARVDEVFNRCDGYSRAVSEAYARQHAPSPERSEAALKACLREKGIEITNPLAPGDVQKLVDDSATQGAFFECANKKVE